MERPGRNEARRLARRDRRRGTYRGREDARRRGERFLPAEERRFITEDLIRSTGGLVGTPDEIIAMLHEREAMGLNEISLLPAMKTARQNLKDFAEQVIARY